MFLHVLDQFLRGQWRLEARAAESEQRLAAEQSLDVRPSSVSRQRLGGHPRELLLGQLVVLTHRLRTRERILQNAQPIRASCGVADATASSRNQRR